MTVPSNHGDEAHRQVVLLLEFAPGFTEEDDEALFMLADWAI
ncbi:MAG: hypothetical protein R6U56_03155 [Opitutales bacterium]